MSSVLAAAAYGLVGLLLACRIATLAAYHWMGQKNVRYDFMTWDWPTGEQWFGGLVLGLIAGAIWPLVLVAYALRGTLFAPPADVQMERQAKRIAELEAELGLRTPEAEPAEIAQR